MAFRDAAETRSLDALDAVLADNDALRAKVVELERAAAADAVARPWRKWGKTEDDARWAKRLCATLVLAILVVNAWNLSMHLGR